MPSAGPYGYVRLHMMLVAGRCRGFIFVAESDFKINSFWLAMRKDR